MRGFGDADWDSLSMFGSKSSFRSRVYLEIRANCRNFFDPQLIANIEPIEIAKNIFGDFSFPAVSS